MRTSLWSSTVVDAMCSTLKMFILELERPTLKLIFECCDGIKDTQRNGMLACLESGGCPGSFLRCDDT